MRPSRSESPPQSRNRTWAGRVGLLGVLVGVALLLLSAVGAGTASATTSPCVPVRLTGEGVATSPTTTVATIYWQGRGIATTTGEFTNGANGSFQGKVVFTPKRIKGGTLVAQVAGAYGPEFTSFTADGPVKGTGNLSRAYGHLYFKGPIRADGTFSETVTGTLCADLRSW